MKTIKFNSYVSTVFNKSLDFQKHIDDLTENREQFTPAMMADKNDARLRLQMLSSLKSLARRINSLLDQVREENSSMKVED